MGIKTDIPVCVGVRRLSECTGKNGHILKLDVKKGELLDSTSTVIIVYWSL